MGDSVRAFVVVSKPFTSAWGDHAPGEIIYEHMIADGSAGLGIERLVHLGLLEALPEVDSSEVPTELTEAALRKRQGRRRGPQGSDIMALAAEAFAPAEDPGDGPGPEEAQADRAPGQPAPSDDPNANAEPTIANGILTGQGPAVAGGD